MRLRNSRHLWESMEDLAAQPRAGLFASGVALPLQLVDGWTGLRSPQLWGMKVHCLPQGVES